MTRRPEATPTPSGTTPPVLGFAAWSGTGKTTLLRALIPRLRERGLRIGLIKHAHHGFEIDHPGKDSYELRKAGADLVMVTSSRRRAVIQERDSPRDPVLAEELAHFPGDAVDLILVEGFRHVAIPKIEIHRGDTSRRRLELDPAHVIAVASDDPNFPSAGLPLLDLNDPEQIAEFIVREFLPY